jgi:hypothetical protein
LSTSDEENKSMALQSTKVNILKPFHQQSAFKNGEQLYNQINQIQIQGLIKKKVKKTNHQTISI